MKYCKSCQAVVPEHLDGCPHCQCNGWCSRKHVLALSTVALLGLAGCGEDEDTGPGPEPEYGVANIDTDTDGDT
jgi:hypothetical protein